MSPALLVGAAAQLAVALCVGWVIGDLLLEGLCRLGGARSSPEAHDVCWPERSLFAVVGLVLGAVAAMVAHIVTGGAVLGLPGVVPALCAVTLWRGWRRGRRPRGIPWLRAAGAVVALGVVYAYPALAGGSGLRTGDVPWHMGWTEQLLAGEPVPTGPAPRYGANAYPWGFHAVLATMVRAVPGTSPAVALEALGLLMIVAIPLAGACLARRVRRDAGWWGAAATAAIGGLGWLHSWHGGGIDAVRFETSPARAGAGADLVVASPNSVYELFPPALPRELGLVLLAGAGLAGLVTLRSRGAPAGVVPGVLTGLVGLVSVPMFVSASLWTLVTGAARSRGLRAPYLRVVGLSSALVFALWAGPVVADVVRFGGFVDITPHLGREWSLPVALASWGVLVPLAALGLVSLVGSRAPGHKVVLSWVLVTAVLLALARVRALFSWGLAGNATLLHQGRVWPVAHLLGAALAGAGLGWIRSRPARRARVVGSVVGAALLCVGAVSPVLASRSLAATIRAGEGGFHYGQAQFASGSFLRRAAERLDADDVVEVRGPPGLALGLWQFSGARLATYDDPRLTRNELRIRFRELAAAWDRRMADEGFAPDYRLLPRARLTDEPVLERGRFGGRRWVLVAAR